MSIDLIALVKKELAADDAVATSGATTLNYSPQQISHRLHYLLERYEQAMANLATLREDAALCGELTDSLGKAKETERNLRDELQHSASNQVALNSELAALRQRHAEAVERAWREGHRAGSTHGTDGDNHLTESEAWLASKAKAALEGKP